LTSQRRGNPGDLLGSLPVLLASDPKPNNHAGLSWLLHPIVSNPFSLFSPGDSFTFSLRTPEAPPGRRSKKNPSPGHFTWHFERHLGDKPDHVRRWTHSSTNIPSPILCRDTSVRAHPSFHFFFHFRGRRPGQLWLERRSRGSYLPLRAAPLSKTVPGPR